MEVKMAALKRKLLNAENRNLYAQTKILKMRRVLKTAENNAQSEQQKAALANKRTTAWRKKFRRICGRVEKGKVRRLLLRRPQRVLKGMGLMQQLNFSLLGRGPRHSARTTVSRRALAKQSACLRGRFTKHS